MKCTKMLLGQVFQIRRKKYNVFFTVDGFFLSIIIPLIFKIVNEKFINYKTCKIATFVISKEKY